MRTEEALKCELARLRKEHTALLKLAVQDATSWQRMDTIERKTNNVLNQLTEHFPGWEDDPDRIPQFGLVAEQVEKVNPDLVVRDTDGKINTVRYQAVNAMLHNDLLKEHRKSEEQGATITQLPATVAQLQKDFQATAALQRKQIEVLTASLKEQASQIQRLSDSLELRVSDPLELRVSDPLELSKAATQMAVNNQ
jgi:septal ring factor EnvC (AmiA/AmiB activator)